MGECDEQKAAQVFEVADGGNGLLRGSTNSAGAKDPRDVIFVAVLIYCRKIETQLLG